MKHTRPLPSAYFSVRTPSKHTSKISTENCTSIRVPQSCASRWIRNLCKRMSITGVKEISAGVPSAFALSQNYPNPFNPTTTFEFSILQPGFVSMKIFNVLGEEVATLVEKDMSAGTYSATWDADGVPSGMSSKGGCASGVYLCRLQAGAAIQTRSVMLLK